MEAQRELWINAVTHVQDVDLCDMPQQCQVCMSHEQSFLVMACTVDARICFNCIMGMQTNPTTHALHCPYCRAKVEARY
ncbi:hypothetical protein [Streptomyces sp. NPDC086023]|uniref:hypothetical protein n=1 Tax=Streptomyces sp. NPDC086023 TaxID=3365746 RepID=UPI0037CD5D60